MSERPPPTVFVVDDDQSIRKSLERLVESVGLRAEMFASADEFLAVGDPSAPGCLLLDIRMPGMSGLMLQQELRTRGFLLPVVMITGHGDVEVAVRSMKAGAFDFLEKPFKPHVLIDTIQRAIQRDAESRRRMASAAGFSSRLGRLSPREREVLDHLVAGNTLKQVAHILGISYKTAQVHRTRILEKLELNSMADVFRGALLHPEFRDNPVERLA